MRYLCIETSHSNGFVSLFTNQKKEKEVSWKGEKHSEELVQNLNPFLKEEINFIAVNVGPGRFTGIRVGVNCAKTMAYGLSCSIFPCISLRLLAEGYLIKTQKPILCLMEAFGEKFYTAIYQKVRSDVRVLLEPSSFSIQEIEPWLTQPMIGIGNIHESKKSLFLEKRVQGFIEFQKYQKINSQDFASFVWNNYQKENLKSWHDLEPLYLRIPGVFFNKTNEKNG